MLLLQTVISNRHTVVLSFKHTFFLKYIKKSCNILQLLSEVANLQSFEIFDYFLIIKCYPSKIKFW